MEDSINEQELTDEELDLIKSLDLFNSQTPEKQWEFVAIWREEGELIIDKDSTIFRMNFNDGLIGDFKLKEPISMEVLLKTFGFNFKINNNG